MNILSALWLLLTWCFSTRASVATVLIMHPFVSSRLWVNELDLISTDQMTLINIAK